MGQALAGGAVHTVGGDDQVVLPREPVDVRSLGGEPQFHAERAAACVQDLQEPVPAQRGEAVAAGAVPDAPVHYVDVVPADEVLPQGFVDDRIGVFYAAQGFVGEDHSGSRR